MKETCPYEPPDRQAAEAVALANGFAPRRAAEIGAEEAGDGFGSWGPLKGVLGFL